MARVKVYDTATQSWVYADKSFGKDGYTPVKGVDYYTEAERTEFESLIVDELAKRGQLKPEFANSIEECTDTSKMYVLPDGYIYASVKKTVEGSVTPNFKNLLDDAGYVENTYLSSGNAGTRTGVECSGFMPFDGTGNYVIHLSGITATASTSNFRFAFYDASKSIITQINSTQLSSNSFAAIPYEIGEDGDIVKLDCNALVATILNKDMATPSYFRLCSDNIDDKSIITVNEEITYTTVEGGTKPNFTNRLPRAEDMSSTEPFNSIGYMTGAYLSATTSGYNSGVANEWVTGFIPYTADKPIYIKGVALTTASHDRLYAYDSKKGTPDTAIGGNAVSSYFTVEQVDDYYKMTPISGAGFSDGIQYVRMSFTTGTPADVIITVNEPITYTTTEGDTVYQWANTGHAFVPADYEDRILALESENAQLKSDLDTAEQRIEALENAESTVTTVPESVQAAASELVDKALSRNGNRILRFLISTDGHQKNDDVLITKGNKELGQAHGEILKLMGVDFVANLGDITWGSSGSDNATVLEEAKAFNKFMLDNIRGQTQIWTEGNHETSLLTESQIHGLIYSHNNGLVQNTDQWIDGYGYMDFPNQKVRVICLNTDQATGNDTSGVSDTQLKWFAETALDMSGKTDWSVITMGHHPLDVNNITMMKNCMWVLEAFLTGANLDFTTNTGTQIAVDYGDKSCQYIGHFHGHAHAFSVVKMQKWVASETYEEVDAWEICIPNACYTRNNQYLSNGLYTERYSTPTTYEKEDVDGKRTSFNVVTVCLDAKKIYADNYGAGIDREISY